MIVQTKQKGGRMTITKQISVISRILNNSRLHTCPCGFQCMPMIVSGNKFTCPECENESEIQ